MTLELRKRVVEFLSSKPDQKFKARDIANWICEKFPNEAAEKLAASVSLKSENELVNQLVAEIGANRPNWQERHKELRTTEGVRPRLYYWTTKSEEEEVKAAESEVRTSATIPSEKLREHDLYIPLIEFLRADMNLDCHRIDDRKSSNRDGMGANRWLYPDVVGIQDLTRGLNPEVVTAISSGGEKRIRLWSFEVKMLINRSNVREAYYQAVSNSSWANYGYLVATEIEGQNTLDELAILHAMHGIGLISLDYENPSESQTLIPAVEKPEIQWPMCSRLATENKDFLDFIKRIRKFFQTGDL